MRVVLACLMIAAAPAWAQMATPPGGAAVKAQPPCAECGVVRSVRTIRKELPASAAADSQPSGLVASIPLGGGGKAQVGSSSRYGKDALPMSQRWEVTVRLDDGRFRILTLDDEPEVREGDKVRIDANGQVSLRSD